MHLLLYDRMETRQLDIRGLFYFLFVLLQRDDLIPIMRPALIRDAMYI